MSAEHDLELARAMAVRSFNEMQRGQRRCAELTTTPYQEPSPEFMECMVNASAEIYRSVITEPATLSKDKNDLIREVWEQLPDNIFEKTALESQRAYPLNPPLTGKALRSLTKSSMTTLVSTLLPDSDIGDWKEKIARDITCARELSAERGVDIPTVYLDNKLYEELVRRSCRPKTLAKTGLNIARRITVQNMVKITQDMFPAIIQAFEESIRTQIPGSKDSISADDNPSETTAMSAEEMADMFEFMTSEFLEDPKFRKVMEAQARVHRKAIKTCTTEQILRFWGTAGLYALSPTTRKALTGTKDLPHLVAFLD